MNVADKIRMIPVNRIHPNPYQPRQEFNEEEIQRLAASIRENGQLSPIIVRRHPEIKRAYQIAVGERRVRAFKLLEEKKIAAVVRALTDEELATIAIEENVQWDDLNDIELAIAFRNLIDNFGYTVKRVGEKFGLSRSRVSNILRLLNLEPMLMEAVRQRTITSSHALELLQLPPKYNVRTLMNHIFVWDLTVIELRSIIKEISEGYGAYSWVRTVPVAGLHLPSGLHPESDLYKCLLGFEDEGEQIDIQESGEVLRGYRTFQTLKLRGDVESVKVRINYFVRLLLLGEHKNTTKIVMLGRIFPVPTEDKIKRYQNFRRSMKNLDDGQYVNVSEG